MITPPRKLQTAFQLVAISVLALSLTACADMDLANITDKFGQSNRSKSNKQSKISEELKAEIS